MAEAEKAVSITFHSLIVIQADRIHHTQKVTIIGNSDERLQEQQINNQPAPGKSRKYLCL